MSEPVHYQVVVQVCEDAKFNDVTGEGFYLHETWKAGSEVHRDFGPAITLRHPVTLVAVREEFYQHGRLHRYGGPALIARDAITGEVINARFFEKGREIPSRDPFATLSP